MLGFVSTCVFSAHGKHSVLNSGCPLALGRVCERERERERVREREGQGGEREGEEGERGEERGERGREREDERGGIGRGERGSEIAGGER